jgi:hypothetical protein
VSDPSDDKDDKEATGADFTDADTGPPYSEEVRDLRLAFKPEPRRTTWTRAAWTVIFWGGVGLGAYYLASHTPPPREPNPPPQPGWDRLTKCSFVTSFDGNKNLSFSEDGRAELSDNTDKDKEAITGEWRFDEESNLFAVTFANISNSYAMAEPGQGPICMLLKGDVRAADLTGSWFAKTGDESSDGADDVKEAHD